MTIMEVVSSFAWENTPNSYMTTSNARGFLRYLAAHGLAILPKEPTDEMCCRGDEEIIETLREIPQDAKMSKGTPAHRCFRAMVTKAEASNG